MKIEQIVNFNIKKKDKEIKLAYLYIFEQILQMYKYSSEKTYGDRNSVGVFTQRMRFVGVVKDKIKSYRYGDKHKETAAQKKIAKVMHLLDSGDRALDIIRKVGSEDLGLDSFDVKAIERGMEQNSINFPKSFDQHPYSYLSMHTILSNPIPILQMFLQLPPPSELINLCINFQLSEMMPLPKQESDRKPRRRIRHHRESFKLSDAINTHQAPKFELKELLQHVSDEKISFNKDNFSREIENSIEEVLLEWSNSVLNKVFPELEPRPSMVDVIIDDCDLKDSGILNINPSELERLCSLGQANELGELIARRLKALYINDKDDKEEVLHEKEQTLSQVAKWFKACNSGYVTEISQIPSHIAAVLYHRVTESEFINYLTASNDDALSISNKNAVEEYQTLVTDLIHKHLFFDNLCYKMPHTHSPDPFKSIKSVSLYLEENSKLAGDMLPNKAMSDWAFFDKKKTRDRFKRPWKAFRDQIGTTERKVKTQQQKSLHQPFPVIATFPLPFWAVENRANKNST